MDFDFTTETITPDATNILTVAGTGALELPYGVTLDRPSGAIDGAIRYNTSISTLEFKKSGVWTPISGSPLTTKGDIYTYSTTDARLPIGTSGYFLKANSSTSTGLEWVQNPALTMSGVTHDPTGFPNRIDSSISFNETTRVFTIQPTSTQFSVFQQGVEFIKTAAESITIPNSTDEYFIYYDTDGVLQSSTTFFNLEIHAPVAVVYWNSAGGYATLFAEERHGLAMDWATHLYLHRTHGAQYISGFEPTNYTVTGNGNNNSDAQLGIAGGSFADEDITITIVNSASPTLQFEQVLNPIGEFPVLYRLGTNGDWYIDSATTFPLKMGTTYPYWNEYTGSTWQLTETDTTRYIVMFIIATNDLRNPVVALMGQGDFANLTDAQKNDGYDSLNLSGIPFLENRPLYRLIYEVKSSYSNSVKAKLAELLDIRVISAVHVIDQIVPGTVTSVGLSLPASVFSVSGSPVTSTGTLTGTFNTQSANTFFAGPSTGSPAVPTFRTVSLDEMSDVVLSAPSTNQVLTFNGTNWVNSSVGGTGTVTSVSATGSTGLTIGGSPITTSGTLTFTLDTGLQNLASFNSTGILVATGTDTWTSRTITAASGKIVVTDGNGVAGNPAIDLGTVNLDDLADVTAPAPAVGQVLLWNGTAWVPYGGAGAGGGLRTWSGNIASQTGTSVITPGVTAPLVTAGTQLMSLTVTPLSTNSRFSIQLALSVSASTNNNVHTAAVFRGSTYIGGAIQTFASGGNSNAISVNITDAPATTSAVTYSIRYGTNANTWYVNRRVAENTYGGVQSGWEIQEY